MAPESALLASLIRDADVDCANAVAFGADVGTGIEYNPSRGVNAFEGESVGANRVGGSAVNDPLVCMLCCWLRSSKSATPVPV